jgi:DNA polymerase III gamma/tau subunit
LKHIHTFQSETAAGRHLSNQVFQYGTNSTTVITMTSKYVSLSIAFLAASLVALPAAAQSTLPASVQADRATIQQDQALVQNIVQQLKIDEAAGNSAAVAADRTALRLAHMKTGQDLSQLRRDAQPTLQPDQAALTATLTQLYSDQRANNVSAVQTDQAAVTAAETQLRTDREAIFGGLGKGFDGSHGHRRG